MGGRNREKKEKRSAVSIAVDELLRAGIQTPAQHPDQLWEQHLALRLLTDRITSAEAAAGPPTRTDRKQAIQNFMIWVKENGVDTEGIEISEFPGYDLGLKATKSFEKGSSIVNIPRKLIMTEDCAKKSILGSIINSDRILSLMPNITLVMYLLLAKFTPDSFWKPYIDILPTSYNTVLYFSPNDLLELKGSPNLKLALKFYQDIARQYAYFYKQLHNSQEPVAKTMSKFFTYRDYCWAVSTVMTRLNIVPSESVPGMHTTALIPLWDMCNHTNGEITTHYNVELDRAECFSLKDYKAGDQILIFYGVRTNAFFFLHNGFVYPENEHDSIVINLGISPSDPLEQQKRKLLEKLDINATTVFKIVNQDLPLSEELLAFARVLVMDKDNLTYWLEENTQKLKQFENVLIKPEFEKKAYSFINTRCKLLLKTYEHQGSSELIEKLKISEDDGGAKKYPENENHKALVRQLKKCESKLLEKAIEFTQLKL